MLIPMELYQVIITEGSPNQAIVLREKNGSRVLPIFIGFNEAMAIDRKIKDVQIERPLTHDLLANTIEKLGGKVSRILITDLRESTFYATIEVQRDGETIEIDSRPSDAIALSVRTTAPLLVEELVLARAVQA